MDALTAIRTRRSVRSFTAARVERALVEDILWDAAQAPVTPLSGAWLFTVIEGADRVAACGARALAHARVHRPPGPGYDWVERSGFSVFHGAPVAIVISAPEGNGQSLADCTRAGQNLMLAAHARGLGTCWVGAPMLWLSEAAVRRELAIPDGLAPFAAFALGNPAGPAAGAPRERPRIVWIDGDDPWRPGPQITPA